MSRGIVIAGGGQAGLQAALSLREQGWGGAITIVSNEAYLPYQRPPLSKGFLSGDVQARQLELRPATVLAEAGVEVVLETEVTGIDRERRIVATTRGELPYLDLILAMGGAPRRLAQVPAGCTNLLYLRTLDDALRLREAMNGASRIVIVGGGFLGLEAAASAAKAGKSVVSSRPAPSCCSVRCIPCWPPGSRRCIGRAASTSTWIPRRGSSSRATASPVSRYRGRCSLAIW
jgi:3-phenylpropionate/trans-cinnamate dioxygenase ferredoxin reductase subunit